MIPYATAAEAEGALGRPMTWAEAAWFLLCVVYTLVPLPLALLELRTSAKQTSPPYKLQPRVRRTPADFIRCYKNTVRVVAPAAGALQLVSYPAVKVHTTSVLRWTSNNQLMSCRI